MRLSELQAKLWPAITERSAEGATGVVRDDLRLGPERRLEIYSQMYFWRLVDALREDFPNLSALLGEDAFTKLVEGYVRAYPSEHPSLGRLGRKMALFLSEHRFGDGRPTSRTWRRSNGRGRRSSSSWMRQRPRCRFSLR